MRYYVENMAQFYNIHIPNSFESPRSPSPSRAVGHWTNSLYQYFEREQARLEGLPDPHKKSKIVETLAAARDRAR